MNKKPYVWIYRPDHVKSMRKLAEALNAEFGWLKGVPIYDDRNIEPIAQTSKANRQKREVEDAKPKPTLHDGDV